jgi:hypothetical protein
MITRLFGVDLPFLLRPEWRESSCWSSELCWRRLSLHISGSGYGSGCTSREFLLPNVAPRARQPVPKCRRPPIGQML